MKSNTGVEIEVLCTNYKNDLHLLHFSEKKEIAMSYAVVKRLKVNQQTDEAEWDYGLYFDDYDDAFYEFCKSSFDDFDEFKKRQIVKRLSERYALSKDDIVRLYNIAIKIYPDEDMEFDIFNYVSVLCEKISCRKNKEKIINTLEKIVE